MAVQPEGSVHEGICIWEHRGDRMALAWVHVQPVGEGEGGRGEGEGVSVHTSTRWLWVTSSTQRLGHVMR